MDVFIAYHGDSKTGSEKEAKQIFDLLKGCSKGNGEPLEVFFQPVTGKKNRFARTPDICNGTKVFLLVANENGGMVQDGRIEEFRNGEKRRLYEEIFSFSDNIFLLFK